MKAWRRRISVVCYKKKILPLLIIGLFYNDNLNAQNYSLKLTYNSSSHKNETIVYPDSISLIRGIDNIVTSLQFQGYLLAEISRFYWEKNQAYADINENQRFRLVHLRNGNIDTQLLKKTVYKEYLFNGTPFNEKQLSELLKALVEVYENNGYPFASVSMDSIVLADSLISAKFYVQHNRLITMDSIVIVGNAKISSAFLQAYLGIRPSSHYDESTIKMITKRLSELSFVQPVKNPEVRFYASKARVTLFLNKRNANQFDGILGFLPDTQTGKLQLTGNAKVQLQNTFKRAEFIGFDFKGLPKQSRELNLNVNLPYIASTPIGVDVAFNLYKQDTSFQNISFKTTAVYRLSSYKSLSFYIEDWTGNSINPVNTTPASSADINTTLYGLNFIYKKLDDMFNPSRGVVLKFDAGAGPKNAKSPGIPSFNSEQYRLQMHTDIYRSFTKNNVVYLKNQTAFLLGDQLFDNELFQLGGFYDLRGFDERSIFASSYSFFNVEYRYLFDQHSFLSVFFNQAFIKRETIKLNEWDNPLGFGAGAAIETKAGIVSLNYAVGKQHNNPVNLRRGKIHFGFAALF